MRLSELKTGQSATILNVLGHGGFRRRIMEMGFVRGKRVDVLQNAPLRDPIKYRIMDYEVSLRRSEAAMIVVITAEEVQQQLSVAGETLSAPDDADFEEAISTRSRTINVALIGNPNSGKTSLFNAISGGHEHVGNYSGVTVDAKRGEYRYGGYRFVITDLPGTYALSAYTPEELYVRRHLVNDTPDVVVNAVVASNLERNLYLTTELIDIDPKMVVALNMYDELEASGAVLDYEHLGAMLGVPMVPVVAKTGRGLEALLDTVIAVYENRDPRVRHIHINNGPVVEQALRPLYERLRSDRDELPKHFPPRYFAMKLLERDKEVEAQLADCPHFAEWIALRDRAVPQVEEELGEDVETALANQKYGFISGALKETFTPGGNGAGADDAYHRCVRHAQAVGVPDLFLPHVADVLLHVQHRRLSAGVDRDTGGLDRFGVAAGDARRSVQGSADRRRDRRRGKRDRLPAQYHHPLPVHLLHGGFRLSGPRSIHHGSRDAPHRTARQVVHSAGDGFRMQRAGHYGHAHDRKPFEQAHHGAHHPLHVVQRAVADLHPLRRNLLSRPRRAGALRTIPAGHRVGGGHGAADAAVPLQGRRDAVRHGAAAPIVCRRCAPRCRTCGTRVRSTCARWEG